MARFLGFLRDSVQSTLARAANLLPVFVIELWFGTVLLALHLLLRGESSFLAAAQFAVRYQAFQEKLGCRNNLGWSIRCFDAYGGQLLKEALDLLQIRKSRNGGLIVIELHRPAQ